MSKFNDYNEDSVYLVDDLDDFIDSIRKIVFSSFGSDMDNKTDDEINKLIDSLSDDTDELDEMLNLNECLCITKECCELTSTFHKSKKHYIITQDEFTEIVEAFNSRLVSNILTRLVKEEYLEMAYSDEDNDFVFWATEKGHENDK